MGIWEWAISPVHALPLDIFRVLLGVVTLAYFARTFREAPTFSAPDGLVDHDLLRRELPFTRLGLFPAGASLALLRVLYASGCVASVLLVLGVATQASALWLYLLAVSTYRWNLILMYVDDAVMHLALFWAVLLPLGQTLTLPGLLASGGEAWQGWLSVAVPGLGVRSFLLNLGLIYLVAGLWKWTSPMWRSGLALYAILKMAVAHAPDRWRPAHVIWLRLANYSSLILEPVLPLLVVVPTGSPLKAFLAAGAIGFHVGIIATLKFPFANLAMLAAGVVVFGPEIAGALGAPDVQDTPRQPGPADLLGLGTLACLALLFLTNALWFRAGAPTTTLASRRAGRPKLNPLYVPLWIIGLAQSYRLFDWIDDRNYAVEYEVVERGPDGPPRRVPATELFPVSMRHILLQSYLYGNLWVRIDPASLPELRAGILHRYARRYARLHPADATIEVAARVRRVTWDNLDLHRETRTNLLRFTVRKGLADVSLACVTPPAYG